VEIIAPDQKTSLSYPQARFVTGSSATEPFRAWERKCERNTVLSMSIRVTPSIGWFRLRARCRRLRASNPRCCLRCRSRVSFAYQVFLMVSAVLALPEVKGPLFRYRFLAMRLGERVLTRCSWASAASFGARTSSSSGGTRRQAV
jgi:hypothetical protein